MRIYKLTKIIIVSLISFLQMSTLGTLALVNTGEVYADSYITLPGAYTSKELLDGSQIEFSLSREHVKLIPSVVAVWTSHQALVSGVYTVKIPSKAIASIEVGYLTGCSLNYNNGIYQFANNLDGIIAEGGAWQISPAVHSWLPQFQWESPYPGVGIDFGDEVFTWTGTPGITTWEHVTNKQSVSNAGSLVYDAYPISVDGCAGYASARAKAILTVSTQNQVALLTLWGRPFSLSS